jgi:dihydrofolate reductase
MTLPLTLIAAVARNGTIGRNGDLPWKLSSDLKHFRRATLGLPVIMGRKTFQSVGRPLAGRTTIVVTRDPDFAAPGVVVAHSLAAALSVAEGDRLRRGAADIIIAGGADLYAQALPHARRLLLTEVDADLAGDTTFPDFDRSLFEETAREAHQADKGDEFGYCFVTWVRRDAVPVG